MHFKFSLRHFLIFVVSCGVLLAAMRMGGAVGQAAVAAIGIFATSQLIVAFVGSGARRAFAIGFLVPFCIYLAVHIMSTQNQLDPYSEKAFPTTRSFQLLHRALVDRTWIDETEAEIPPSDPRVAQLIRDGGTAMYSSAGTVTLRERPSRSILALVSSLKPVLEGSQIRFAGPHC